jgi:hypothetical protein
MRPFNGSIPQTHLGIRFKSKTEAKWAQFFHSQRIPFLYEPKAIGNGKIGYLVDFQFHASPYPVFFEVKPYKPTPIEYEKLVLLANVEQAHVFVSHGAPSRYVLVEKVFRDGHREQWYFAYEYSEGCGYLVNCLAMGPHALPLRKVTESVGYFDRGPEAELDAAGNYQFDSDQLAGHRVKASPQLRRVVSRQLSEERRVVRQNNEQDFADWELSMKRKVSGRDE